MPHYPKFEQKIYERVVQPQLEQGAQPGYGIVMDYNAQENTATVLMSSRGSEDVDQLYTKVPCPVYMGVQSAAPEKGRHCWVSFKDNSTNYPVVTHYFNHFYSNIDYDRHNLAVNVTPRYMLNM